MPPPNRPTFIGSTTFMVDSEAIVALMAFAAYRQHIDSRGGSERMVSPTMSWLAVTEVLSQANIVPTKGRQFAFMFAPFLISVLKLGLFRFKESSGAGSCERLTRTCVDGLLSSRARGSSERMPSTPHRLQIRPELLSPM